MIGLGAVIATLSAQALAVYVFGAWMGAGYSGDKHAVSAFTLVGVTLTAYLFPRFLAGFDLSDRQRHVIAAVVTFVVVYGVLRIEFGGDFALWDFRWVEDFMRKASATASAGSDALLGAMLVIGCWAWGLYKSSDEVDLEFIPRSLAGPFGCVTVVVIAATPSSAVGEVVRGAIAFYAVAVLALSLSQLARSGATIGSLRAGGITASLLAGVTAVTVGLVIVAGLLWGPLAGPVGTVLANVIEAVLTVVLTPIAWTIEKVMRFLLGESELTSRVEEIRQGAPEDAGDPNEEQSSAKRLAAYTFRLMALAIVAGAVYAFLAFMTRLRKRTPQTAAPADRSRVGSLGDDLKSFARNLIPGWRRGYGPAPDSDAVRLYIEVLKEAEARGRPRAAGQTPEEFAPELANTFSTPVTDDITLTFEEARYGGKAVDRERVEQLQRRWRARDGLEGKSLG